MRRRALLCAALALISALILFAGQADARAPEQIIVVDVERMTLTLYEDRAQVKRYPVAAGAYKTPSPLGVFKIVGRFSGDPGGFGTCFLGLNVPWGTYGIHGTNKPNSIGYNASHGCIRMYNRDVEELYKRVSNGATVIIEGGAYGELGDSLRMLRPGDRNAHVRAVQRKLRALGYYHGNPDGVYGNATSAAIKAFRKANKLGEADVVDYGLYGALGILLFE